ncbi:MAG: J domain-containing protein, partial [Mesorhizobium sp.]
RRQQGPGGAHFEFRTGRPGGDPFDGNSDIFSQIFGDAFSGARGAGPRGAGTGDRRQPVQAADLNVTMDISVEEAATADKVTAMFPDGRKVAVKLPAYVEDGQTIRLKGQGEQGPGQPGDALVKIHIRRHPRYRIEGRDLHVDLPVDLADAVLGAKVAVETPTGKLAVNVPAWSSSDKVLRLKGRGLPEKAGGHGDLYAHVRLMLPEGGDAELETLMRRQKS